MFHMKNTNIQIFYSILSRILLLILYNLKTEHLHKYLSQGTVPVKMLTYTDFISVKCATLAFLQFVYIRFQDNNRTGQDWSAVLQQLL